MEKVKVRYSVTELLTYRGIAEIELDQYNEWKDKDDETLGDLILDFCVKDRNDPQDWSIDSVDEFELI